MAPSCSSVSETGDAFFLPSWPLSLWRVGWALALVSALLALTWWGSMAWAVWQGRVEAWALVAPAIVLGLAMMAPVQLLRQHRNEQALPLWRWQNWLRLCREDARWGLSAQLSWRDCEGQPAILSVLFDFGPWLLVQAKGIDAAAKGYHWVREIDLPGPWRWRLVHSGLRQPAPAALLASSCLMSGQAHADLPPRSDFLATQTQEDGPSHAREPARWRGRRAA